MMMSEENNMEDNSHTAAYKQNMKHVDGANVHRDPKTVRDKLEIIIESRKFHITIIVLVIVDVILVLGELILDLEISADEDHIANVLPEILHYASIAILSLFVVEVCVKLFVMRMTFFKHKLEMFDALVVFVAFALDVAFASQGPKARQAIGLLVILRLWRITRIINGIILSVKADAGHKIDKEKHTRINAERNFFELRAYCVSQDEYIERLESLLSSNNINVPDDEGSGSGSNRRRRPEHLFTLVESEEVLAAAAVVTVEEHHHPTGPVIQTRLQAAADAQAGNTGKYVRLVE